MIKQRFGQGVWNLSAIAELRTFDGNRKYIQYSFFIKLVQIFEVLIHSKFAKLITIRIFQHCVDLLFNADILAP